MRARVTGVATEGSAARAERPEDRRRPFLIAGGVLTFLCVNLVLFLDRCSMHQLTFDCSGSGGMHTVAVVVIGSLLFAGAWVHRNGRAFAKGFAYALVALGVLSLGSCTPSWVDPYYTVRWKVEPFRLRWVQSRREAAMRRDWIATLNGRPMDVARGVELAGDVVSCAQASLRETGRVSTNEDALASRCGHLAVVRFRVNPGAPRRYEIPVAPGGRDMFGEPVDQVRGDAGWRFTYVTSTAGFAVDVRPDRQLAHAWPRIRGDGAREIQVQMSETTAAVDVSPAGDLRIMTECLKGIPAEVERLRVARHGLDYGWSLISMTTRLCPGPAARVVPSDSNATLLSVTVPSGSDPAPPVIAAAYLVRYVWRSPTGTPFAFDLRADAKSAGLPHYWASFEGAVHWTAEARPATSGDPLVGRWGRHTGPREGRSHPLPTIVIRLDPALLADPDLDLRYEIPRRLESAAAGLLQDSGYDYEFDGDVTGFEAMQIYLATTDAAAALPFVVALLEGEKLFGNDLTKAAIVGISEAPPDVAIEFAVVYPPGGSGRIRARPAPAVSQSEPRTRPWWRFWS